MTSSPSETQPEPVDLVREATIDAVAAAPTARQTALAVADQIRAGRESGRTSVDIARALAEAGWLKDPADRVLTPTDQAVLDAAEAETKAEEAMVSDRYHQDHREIREALYEARDARRVAVRAHRGRHA